MKTKHAEAIKIENKKAMPPLNVNQWQHGLDDAIVSYWVRKR